MTCNGLLDAIRCSSVKFFSAWSRSFNALLKMQCSVSILGINNNRKWQPRKSVSMNRAVLQLAIKSIKNRPQVLPNVTQITTYSHHVIHEENDDLTIDGRW